MDVRSLHGDLCRFTTHADDHIGRLVAHLKETGQSDNTPLVLRSDSVAAPEAGRGGWNPYKPDTPVAEMAANLDKLGGLDTQSLYQRPWAMAGVTSFRRYKLWPYAGAIRTPLIASRQNGIKEHGAVRPQLIDAVNIGPTLLDVYSGRRRAHSCGGALHSPRSLLPRTGPRSSSSNRGAPARLRPANVIRSGFENGQNRGGHLGWAGAYGSSRPWRSSSNDCCYRKSTQTA